MSRLSKHNLGGNGGDTAQGGFSLGLPVLVTLFLWCGMSRARTISGWVASGRYAEGTGWFRQGMHLTYVVGSGEALHSDLIGGRGCWAGTWSPVWCAALSHPLITVTSAPGQLQLSLARYTSGQLTPDILGVGRRGG